MLEAAVAPIAEMRFEGTIALFVGVGLNLCK
jgi:hypothetical protein